jgi:hypothetical protein
MKVVMNDLHAARTLGNYQVIHYIGCVSDFGGNHARRKDEAKAVVRTWRNGDTTIINAIHPMKLALGSYRIIGMPKFARSAEGSRSIREIGPQMRSIRNKVKLEVRKAAVRLFFNK